MSVRFHEQDHKYESIDPDNQVDWISVTSLTSVFKTPFDAVKVSERVSKNPRSKWYSLPPERIRKIWENESLRSTEMGSSYHKQRDTDISQLSTIQKDGVDLIVNKSLYDHALKVKLAPDQVLQDNSVYPEHFMYLSSIGICGQSDKVEVLNGRVNISDYKTSKKIEFSGFVNWEGVEQKMLSPVDNLPDCHASYYALQMSLYMYMILKHNPQFSPGTLILDHVIFEQEDTDQYGYPVYAQDDQGNFIVKELKQYSLPYYRHEVLSMIDYLKDNRAIVKSKLKK